jgi:molecular chaperone GrpE
MSEKRNIEISDENDDRQAQVPESEKTDRVDDMAAIDGQELENNESTAVLDRLDEFEGLKARIEELEGENEKLAEESKNNYDKFLRVTADFENYKKRSNKELNDLRKFATENIVREVLSVVDNLERAIESGLNGETSSETLLQGVEITLKDLLRMLEKFNVSSFESNGELFDPTYHQAMMQEETDDFPENTVVKELQKGYTIHDRLLRPAMVIVSKPATGSNNDKDE